MSAPRFLLCPPDYYGIEYEINPWMSLRQPSETCTARRQWNDFRMLLLSLGAQVEWIAPVSGLPDMVFTANAGVVYEDLFVTSRFRHPERQKESQYFEQWFVDRGFRAVSLAAALDFEGAGDALFCGETLISGYLHRSQIRAHQLLARLLECEALGLELVDPRFYHLDTCFCPLDPQTALWYPGAFDDYGRAVLADRVPKLIEVNEADAERFGCNAVVIGKDVILNSGCPRLERQLKAEGFRPQPTDLEEFRKAGGSAKCLTLRLDGEEAAAWRQSSR